MVFVLVLVFGQSFLDKICRDPTAFRWVACFIAIRALLDESLDLVCLVGWWFLVVCSCELFCLLTPQTVIGPRQNLSTNRLRPCIWSSARITIDLLATTRSFILGKLPALLGNLRLPLPRVAMVGWSRSWRPKSHVGFVQVTVFF